jgi:hypothetical protein
MAAYSPQVKPELYIHLKSCGRKGMALTRWLETKQAHPAYTHSYASLDVGIIVDPVVDEPPNVC